MMRGDKREEDEWTERRVERIDEEIKEREENQRWVAGASVLGGIPL
jgi:hypothetical protein